MNENHTQLPDHIRENLKKFNTHRQVTCLECGYVGLMGINNSKTSIAIFWMVLIAVCIFLATLGISFYIIFFMVFFVGIFKKLLFGDNVVCPSCERDLKTK